MRSHTAVSNFQGFLRLLSAFACGTGPICRRRSGARRNYRCSLGTNTVLGLVTNGLFAVPLDGGAENCSIM
jgi:hypothetical protein